MVYRVIGVAGNQAQQELEIIFAELTETGGKWEHFIPATATILLPNEWRDRLAKAATLTVSEYQQTHTSFGQYIGEQVNHFIEENGLVLKVHLVASSGYPLLLPGVVGVQLGHGAFIAAETGLPVVSDLPALNLALGGQGAPLSSITEKLLPGADLSAGYEPLTVALMGVLRWREETNMLSSFTGDRRNSSGGALWLGIEA